jgi:hypothetical protein
MHPTTTRKLNAKEFADLKHTVSIRSRARRNLLADPGYAAPLPQEVSLQLTYRCNLRCTHCYQCPRGVRKAVGIRRGAISGNMKVSFQAARSIG